MYSPSYQSPPPTYAYQEYRPQSYAYTSTDEYTFSRTSPMKYSTTNPRRTSQTYTYTTSTRPSTYHDPPAYTYTSTGGYTIKTSTAQPRRTDFSSATERLRNKARSFAGPDGPKIQTRSSSSKKERPQSYTPSRTVRESVVVDDKEDVYGYGYSPKSSPPPPYHEAGYQNDYWGGRYFGYDKEKSKSPRQSEVRTSTTKIRPSSNSDSSLKTKQPSKDKKSSTSKSSKSKSSKATAADAAKAGIPAGYSYKNWDPTEEPIYLLGSVFDANSLGRWVYDWTVFHHGPATPMSDMAGDLWLLLIQLAGKIKRADACMPRIRRRSDRELIDDFLESGDRLWDRLSKILKACEDCMWRAAKQERAAKGASVAMGANSGTEFVDTMFGRDRKLEDTEKLMASMRLWNMRFDANCEDILRHPSG